MYKRQGVFSSSAMHLKRQQAAYLYAALSILSWSTISTAFKLSLYHLSPLGLLCISSLTATLFLGIVNGGTGGFGGGFQALRQNLRRSLAAGLLNPFAYYLILFVAYSRLRAQEAQALNYTWAIVLALFSIPLLHEKFRIVDISALLVSLVGVLIISTRGNLRVLRFDDRMASFLALFSSLVWALYWIVSLKDQRPAIPKLFYNFLCGALAIGLFALLSGLPLFLPGGKPLYGILGALYVGIFEMGLTFLLWYKALEKTNSTASVSNLIFLTPFISLLFIATILHESIHPATVIGLLLIVVSNLVQKGILASFKRKR